MTEAGWRLEEVDVPDLYRLSRPSAEIAVVNPTAIF